MSAARLARLTFADRPPMPRRVARLLTTQEAHDAHAFACLVNAAAGLRIATDQAMAASYGPRMLARIRAAQVEVQAIVKALEGDHA